MLKFKKFGKSLSVLLAAVCMAQSVAFAETSSSLDSAIVKVKSVIDIPSELIKFESEKSSDGNGTEYSFSWHLPNSEYSEYSENKCSDITVKVNGKGDIEFYRKSYTDINTQKTLTKLTDEDYASKAKVWICNVVPHLADEYELLDIYSSVNSSDVRITFERKKGEFNYCDNSIFVRLDKQTGEVIYYRLNHLYTDDEANSTEILDELKKREGFLNQNSFEKFYIRKGDSNNAILVYSPTNPSVVLNSLTAEIPTLTNEEKDRIKEDKVFFEEISKYTSFYSSNTSSGGGTINAETAEDAAVELSETEIKAIEDYSKLISPEKAEKLIREIENTVIDECELSSYEYYKKSSKDIPVPLYDENEAENTASNTEKELYYAVFNFESQSDAEDKENYRHTNASVAINAETGELIELFSYCFSDDADKVKLDKSVRAANAEKFVEKYSANEAKKAENFDKEVEEPYNFKFYESVNGIKYRDNYISLDVDEYDGKVMRFSKNWTNEINFENSENILTESDIANILFTKIGFDEYYTNISYVDYAPAIRLVYGLKNAYPYYVSAKTGELLDYNGEPKSADLDETDKNEFTDIDGHYAEEIINILLKNDVIKSGTDKKFRPDEVLIYGDAKEILSSLNCYTEEYAKNYKNKTGIMPSDNTVLTRMGAVECIIDSIGYGKAARLKEIYNCDFTDIDPTYENVGYAAIAKALGIVNGDENGNFNPNDNVTRADFSIMIYNMLVSEIAE